MTKNKMSFTERARLGGLARSGNMTKEERSKSARKAAKARQALLSPRERSELARLAVTTRWANRDATKPVS